MRKVARRAKTRKRRQVERAARRERQGRTQTAIDAVIAGVVRTAIEAALVEEVTALLGRGPRERRRRDDATEVAARCNRCGTQRRSQFYRAGTYRRSRLTFEVWTPVRVPRVSCVCGGMVDVEFVHLVPYGLVPYGLVPYGRRWFDVEERARELAAPCASRCGMRSRSWLGATVSRWR